MRRELGGGGRIDRVAGDHHHRDFEGDSGHRGAEIGDVDVGQDAAGDRGADVVVQHLRQRPHVGLVEKGADGREARPGQRQQFRILGQEVEIGGIVLADERLGRGGPGAALAMALQQDAGQFPDHRLEYLVLVPEVVVEGARGEIGAAHDVAHAGRAVAHLGEHGPRGLDEGGAVLGLVLLAPSTPFTPRFRARRAVAHVAMLRHRPSCASSWRRPATMSSIARAAACTAPRMPMKPWINVSNSRWMVLTPDACRRSA